MTRTIAKLGKHTDGISVTDSGAVLARLMDGAGTGPVIRLVNGVVSRLPRTSYCNANKPCALQYESPVWLG